MMSTDTYELVCDVVGKRMDEAWHQIIADLASAAQNGDTSNRSTLVSDSGVTASAITDFFDNLGGANLGISFSSRATKGNISRFTATEVNQGNLSTLGGNVTVTIGGSWSF